MQYFHSAKSLILSSVGYATCLIRLELEATLYKGIIGLLRPVPRRIRECIKEAYAQWHRNAGIGHPDNTLKTGLVDYAKARGPH